MPQATKQPRRISLRAFMILAVLVAAAGLLTAFAIMPSKGNGVGGPAPAELPVGFPVWTHWADYNDTFLGLEDEMGLKEAFATLSGLISNKAHYTDVMRRMGTKYRTDSAGEPIGWPGVDYGYKRFFLCTDSGPIGDLEMVCTTKTFFDGVLKGATEMRNSWETDFEYAESTGLYCLSLVQHILPEDKPKSLKYEYNCARPGYAVNTTGSVSIDLTYSG